ncbi:hypothetical protein BJ742DRAFT_877754 [Cladochytrium replicatum]|nr:hypothetical protein BJ742DRAFT_877754 [Cladochytrium replicatum]
MSAAHSSQHQQKDDLSLPRLPHCHHTYRPGGFTLASILQRNNFSNVDVYDSDDNRNARDQGGSLYLKRETGQEALKRAGLFERFRALARVESEELIIADKTAKVYLHDASPAVDDDGLPYNPVIERSEHRDVLRDGLSPAFKWNHNVRDIETSNGVSTPKFADETTVKADLVTGADGAWSEITPLFEGAATRQAEFRQTQRKRSYAALSVLEDWNKTSDLATATDPSSGIGWATSLRQLIDYCDPIAVMQPHLMSPYAGEGVNAAMVDESAGYLGRRNVQVRLIHSVISMDEASSRSLISALELHREVGSYHFSSDYAMDRASMNGHVPVLDWWVVSGSLSGGAPTPSNGRARRDRLRSWNGGNTAGCS